MKEDLAYPEQRLRLPVILSPDEVAQLLGALREFYRRTETYLFPGTVKHSLADKPITEKIVWQSVHEATIRRTLHFPEGCVDRNDAACCGGGRSTPQARLPLPGPGAALKTVLKKALRLRDKIDDQVRDIR